MPSSLAALAVAVAVATPAAAQQWSPTQPIRVIIPYAAGGTSDIIARTMSEPVSQRLGQPLTIENRGGGATQIGTSAVAKAAPDGHTILLVANTFMINPSLFKTLPYDSLKDLTPITYAGVTPHTIVVTNDLPAKNLKELLDLARAKPGTINYGSVGIGTSFHLGTEELKKLSGTNMVHVPYKGMGQVLTDLISGNIQMAFGNTPNAAPLVKEGKLRAIAVAHPQPGRSIAGRADRGRTGLSRLRVEFRLHLFRARRHAAGSARPAQRRVRRGAQPAGGERGADQAGRRGARRRRGRRPPISSRRK